MQVVWDADLLAMSGTGGIFIQETDRIVSFTYIPEEESLCIVLSSGSILILSANGHDLEEVGVIQGGCLAAEWSPVGEVLAMVTGAGQLLLMSAPLWQVLWEHSLTDCESIQRSSISWRGDGTFFGVTHSIDDQCSSVLTVWEGDSGELHSHGETVPGLYPIIAWQPNGRNLYTVQCLERQSFEPEESFIEDKVKHVGAWKRELKRQQEAYRAAMEVNAGNRVVLYEKNGLQHGSFDLPGTATVESLQWSPDSEFLAIVSSDCVCRKAQLWTRSNWHWHLKYELRVGKADLLVRWSDSGLLLNIVTAGELVILEFWQSATTSMLGTAAVVDGNRVRITPLRHAVIPPPMCAVTAMYSGTVMCCSFLNSSEKEVLAAVLCDGSVALVSCDEEDYWDELEQEVLVATTLDTGGAMLSARAIAWVDPHTLLVLSGTRNLLEIDVLSNSITKASSAPGAVVSLHSVVLGQVLIQLTGGELYTYSFQSLEKCIASRSLPSACMSIIPLPSGEVVGLNSHGQLFHGGQLLRSDVTSCCLHADGPGGAFLLFTLRNDVLHTLSLKTGLANVDAMSSRAIEQGGKLIASPSDTMMAVLQMPRGNLETVRPRSLVLPFIASALGRNEYKKALDLAISNRVDVNILVDYDWPQFVEEANTVVQQIDNDHELSEVLLALTESSVAAEGGLYHNALHLVRAASTKAEPQPIDKIKSVCRAVRQALESSHELRSRLKSAVTTYYRCGELEEALLLIKDVKEASTATQNGHGHDPTPAAAEVAVRHLLLYCGEEELYRAALGAYELELAYMVVSHSQRDPGEYLLELQEFEAIPKGPERWCAIDMHLGRYEHALRSLVSLDGRFEDALQLAKHRDLLRTLLTLCTCDEQKRATYMVYGQVLESRNKHEDAALAYLAAGLETEAQRAYRAAGQWRMTLALAGKAAGEDCQDAIQSLAAELAVELREMQRHAESGRLLIELLRDIDEGVSLLAEAREWQESMAIAYSHGRSDLVETIIAPRAALAARDILRDSMEDKERILKYWARLKELREKRKNMEAVLTAADADAPALDFDAQSDRMSLVSGMSIYTNSSTIAGTGTATTTVTAPSTVGGKKREAPRKRHKHPKGNKIRAGTPFEEKNLAEHILSLAPPPALLAQAGQLAELLCLLGHVGDAHVLQVAVSSLGSLQSEATKDILQNPPPGLRKEDDPETEMGTQNHPSLYLVSRVESSEKETMKLHWKWDILRST